MSVRALELFSIVLFNVSSNRAACRAFFERPNGFSKVFKASFRVSERVFKRFREKSARTKRNPAEIKRNAAEIKRGSEWVIRKIYLKCLRKNQLFCIYLSVDFSLGPPDPRLIFSCLLSNRTLSDLFLSSRPVLLAFFQLFRATERFFVRVSNVMSSK